MWFCVFPFNSVQMSSRGNTLLVKVKKSRISIAANFLNTFDFLERELRHSFAGNWREWTIWWVRGDQEEEKKTSRIFQISNWLILESLGSNGSWFFPPDGRRVEQFLRHKKSCLSDGYLWRLSVRVLCFWKNSNSFSDSNNFQGALPESLSGRQIVAIFSGDPRSSPCHSPSYSDNFPFPNARNFLRASLEH